MDRRVKERMIGASILVVLLVLVVPELLSGPAIHAPPRQSGAEAVRSVEVDLATSKATAAADIALPVAALPPPAPPALPPASMESAAAPSSAQEAVPGLAGAAAARLPQTAGESPAVAAATVAMPPVANEAIGPTSASQWAVQLGSFASRANAEQLMRRLKTHTAAAYVSSSGSGAGLRYRVRVGPLADRAAAERAINNFKKEGLAASLIPP